MSVGHACAYSQYSVLIFHLFIQGTATSALMSHRIPASVFYTSANQGTHLLPSAELVKFLHKLPPYPVLLIYNIPNMLCNRASAWKSSAS